MVELRISHRTLPAYRQSFLVNESTWITTRTPLYFLDLAVPNEIMFEMHFQKLFPDNIVEIGLISTCDVSKNQRFHLDDISVGCNGRRDSNLFYTYAMTTDRKVDKIGMRLFLDFWSHMDDNVLTSGEKAVQFMNLATLIGYKQWREIVLAPTPDRPYRHLLVDYIFSFLYPSILKGVYEKKSELLVKELWDLFCTTDHSQLMLFMHVPDAEHLKFMLEVSNRIKFDFWGMKHGGKGLTEHIWIHYVEEKRLDLLTVMLDYGFVLGRMDPESSDNICLPSEMPSTHSYFGLIGTEFVPNGLMVQFLVRCYENCSNLIELPGFIEVFQKVSRTLRHPSLSPSVVRKYLLMALDIVSAEKITAIYKTCDVHPSDCKGGVVPQTLSQLSRCVIRDRLAANYQLPAAIGESHLPTLIKSFLSLHF